MNAILGTDAAWTDRQPSGIALARKGNGRWQCVIVAPSYESFMAAGPGQAVGWKHERATGPPPRSTAR